MPRPPRLNIPAIPQHVVQRGNNRQACFFEEADYRLYLALLFEACQRHFCAVHAFVLMTNHVHILITPQTGDGVSLVMRDLGRDYVQTANRKHKRTGTLWEGRFKSSLIDSDAYCLACYRYIESNPVRAGMVGHPGEYRWSSYRTNAEGVGNALVKPHDSWLSLGRNHAFRRRAYRSLFEHPARGPLFDEIRYGIRKGLPAGNRPFKHRIEQELGIKLGDGRRGRRRQSG